MEKEKLEECLVKAIEGDGEALEALILEVEDFVFNLSLRMLGGVADAQDATQDILIRILTHLSSFQGKSSFKTWVYRIATNYLIDYKKHMFSKYPLDFDFYANDIKAGFIEDSEEVLLGIEREVLAEELKLSCTNVLLQCLDPKTRCIFILGTMFKIDSKVAGEVLDLTPENYRQKLSRARKKVADFLSEHCGLSKSGYCCCEKRIEYAIKQHRLQPANLEFLKLNVLTEYKETMDSLDDLTIVFDELPKYKSTIQSKELLKQLLQSKPMEKMLHFENGEPMQ
ncbi:MAG: RNA polymerase sigma factor [Longicatena sp.]